MVIIPIKSKRSLNLISKSKSQVTADGQLYLFLLLLFFILCGKARQKIIDNTEMGDAPLRGVMSMTVDEIV